MNSEASIFLLFILVTTTLFFGCKSSEKQSQTAIAVSHPRTMNFQDSLVTTKFNADKTLKLIVREIHKKGDPASHFLYKVLTTAEQNLIKEGTFRGAQIDWNDKKSLKLIPYIGIEQKPVSENPDEFMKSKNNSQTHILIVKLDTL